MKIVQVIPKAGINSKLKTLLKNTERQLRGPHTTFERERRAGGSMSNTLAGFNGTTQQVAS